MIFRPPKRIFRGRHLRFGLLVLALFPVSACKRIQPADTQPLDQAGMWSNSIDELRALDVSNAEVSELAKARQAGLSDPVCVSLIRLARSRQKPFADGQAVADLLSAGTSEQTVLQLARLNQLGLFAGQAQALRLAGVSDKVIVAVAQRRSQGLTVLSGEKIGELRNAGVSDGTILDMIEQGTTDQQAASYITQRQNAAGGHAFVYQGRPRKKR